MCKRGTRGYIGPDTTSERNYRETISDVDLTRKGPFIALTLDIFFSVSKTYK